MRFAIKLILIALVLFLLPLAQVLAADITVNADCGLQSAISAANEDEAVGGCPAGSGADTLFLTLDISIGRELPRITSEITIDGGNRLISGGGKWRIFHVEPDGSLAIRNLRIIDGGSLESPGAVYSAGALSIVDSKFSGNSNSAHAGGAIYVYRGEATISSSEFSGNSAGFHGGAILVEDGAATISSSKFSGNSAGENGGAISLYGGKVTIRGSEFSGNSAADGGAIHLYGGEATIISNEFSGNSAEENGGAIYNYGTLALGDNTFLDNSPEDCFQAHCVSVPGGGIKEPVGPSAPAETTIADTSTTASTLLQPLPEVPRSELLNIERVACTASDLYFMFSFREPTQEHHLFEVTLEAIGDATIEQIFPIPKPLTFSEKLTEVGAELTVKVGKIIIVEGLVEEVPGVSTAVAVGEAGIAVGEAAWELYEWHEEQKALSPYTVTWYNTRVAPPPISFLVHATHSGGSVTVATRRADVALAAQYMREQAEDDPLWENMATQLLGVAMAPVALPVSFYAILLKDLGEEKTAVFFERMLRTPNSLSTEPVSICQ